MEMLAWANTLVLERNSARYTSAHYRHELEVIAGGNHPGPHCREIAREALESETFVMCS